MAFTIKFGLKTIEGEVYNGNFTSVISEKRESSTVAGFEVVFLASVYFHTVKCDFAYWRGIVLTVQYETKDNFNEAYFIKEIFFSLSCFAVAFTIHLIP